MFRTNDLAIIFHMLPTQCRCNFTANKVNTNFPASSVWLLNVLMCVNVLVNIILYNVSHAKETLKFSIYRPVCISGGLKGRCQITFTCSVSFWETCMKCYETFQVLMEIACTYIHTRWMCLCICHMTIYPSLYPLIVCVTCYTSAIK